MVVSRHIFVQSPLRQGFVPASVGGNVLPPELDTSHDQRPRTPGSPGHSHALGGGSSSISDAHPGAGGGAQTTPELTVDHVTVVEKEPLKKAISGAAMGNLMEWYDFGIYGYLTATMTKVFQPENTGSMGTVITLAVFAVSFLARPFGGFVFGPLGDRIGRQKTLAITMLTMSVATGLIGALPSFASAGWWAFAGLVVLRLIQGFSTGGEYAGATTFAAEYAPDKRRGFFASLLDIGSYLGFAAGALVVAAVSALTSDEQLLSWGWRIPFIIALPLGVVAMYFRMKVEESPTFENSQAANEAAADNDAIDESQTALGPIGIFKHHWRAVLIAMALVGAINTAGYSLTSYMPSYLENSHGFSTLSAALVTIPALVALSVAIPFIGRWSDKVGRKPVLWIAAISALVLTIPSYLLMQNRTGAFVAMFLLAFSVAFYISVSASTLPALFPTASRYGAMAISYNVAVSAFGGTAPMINEWLVQVTGNKLAPAFYTMFFSFLACIALLCMKETARKPLPGSMPAVMSEQEAHELVETQHENPDLDHSELPFEAHASLDSDESRPETTQAPDAHGGATTTR